MNWIPRANEYRCTYDWLWWHATDIDIVNGSVTGPMRGAMEAWKVGDLCGRVFSVPMPPLMQKDRQPRKSTDPSIANYQ